MIQSYSEESVFYPQKHPCPKNKENCGKCYCPTISSPTEKR